MSNGTPSRIGQSNGGGAVDALFKDLFGGEILTAFEMACKMQGKVRERTISGGKSASFPAINRAIGSYHTPGNEILGQALLHKEITIGTDDLLIAPAEIAQIDELRNHYDVRAPYAKELGTALALSYDRIVSMTLINAARDTSELFVGDGAGSFVQESDISGGGDFAASGSDLWDAFGMAFEALDTRDVPVETDPVYGAVKPAQYYLMARSTLNIDKDFGGAGSVQDNNLKNAYGVQVFKSSALLFGEDVTAYADPANTDGLVGAPIATFGPKRALPSAWPSKYQADLSGTAAPVGIVWTPDAVAVLKLLGLSFSSTWEERRQVTFMLAKMAAAAGKLRHKCAVEIRKTA